MVDIERTITRKERALSRVPWRSSARIENRRHRAILTSDTGRCITWAMPRDGGTILGDLRRHVGAE